MRFLLGKLYVDWMPLCVWKISFFITWARCKRWTLNALHQKNHYPVDRVECHHNTYKWILIHSVESVIHPLNNRGLVFWEFFFSWFPPSKWFYIKRIIIKVGSLQFFCLFFDRCPSGYLRQLLQFAFVLFKSGSCLFQELSVPCGSIALAGSYRYVNHPKTGFFGLAIFNLRCSFNPKVIFSILLREGTAPSEQAGLHLQYGR